MWPWTNVQLCNVHAVWWTKRNYFLLVLLVLCRNQTWIQMRTEAINLSEIVAFLCLREPLVLPSVGPSVCPSHLWARICPSSPSPPSLPSPPHPSLLLLLSSLLSLQMIICMIRPPANDHMEDPASCKWSSRGTGLLQTIIWRDQPPANDHLEDPPSCKWSSENSCHLQMIIRRNRPFANDHPEDPAICKWSSGGSGL